MIVTCGAGVASATNNQTGYGNGLEFWDRESVGAAGTAESSYSNGVIAGKLYSIKAALGCNWWEARYRARMTASNGGSWNKYDGYGVINVSAAIAYGSGIAEDPYLPIGTVGTLTGSNADALATLTPAAVTNATHYYLERNTGEGWEPVDVHNASEAFTITLTANVSTQFRYRASNGGGITEYSNTVTLEYEDAVALKRQQIIDALKTRLQLINGVGSYYLNCSSNVYVNRDAAFETAEDLEVPAINILDGDESPQQQLLAGATNVWYRELSIALRLLVNGALADTDVRKGIADIQRAIGTDLTWGGLAIDTIWNR